MKHKPILLLLCAVLLTGVLCSCANRPKDNTTTKIRLNEVTHSVFYAPQYLAMELGYFSQEGLEIELTNGGGADKVMTAVLTGATDIGFAGPESCIYLHTQNSSTLCKVFAQVTKRDGSFLMTRSSNDSDNFSWDQLIDAHVIAGRKGGVPYMTLEHVFSMHGLVPGQNVIFDDSIQFVNTAAAFAAGTGDYVTVFEPTASAFEEQGIGKVVLSVGQESGEIPYTAYFATEEYIKQNSDIIAAFTRAIYKAQVYMQTHTAKEIASALAPQFADTSLDLLEKSVQRYMDIDAFCTTPQMSEEAFDNLQNVMYQAGELSQKIDFDLVVDNTFADNCIK